MHRATSVAQLGGQNATAEEIPVRAPRSVIGVAGSSYRNTDELSAIESGVVANRPSPWGVMHFMTPAGRLVSGVEAHTLNAKVGWTQA